MSAEDDEQRLQMKLIEEMLVTVESIPLNICFAGA